MEREREEDQDTLKGYSSGDTICNMIRYAKDRAGWRGADTAVARGRMRLDGIRQGKGMSLFSRSNHLIFGRPMDIVPVTFYSASSCVGPVPLHLISIT